MPHDCASLPKQWPLPTQQNSVASAGRTLVCTTPAYRYARDWGQFGTCVVFTKANRVPTRMTQRPWASIWASKKTTCPFRNSHSRSNCPVHGNKVRSLVIATKGKNRPYTRAPSTVHHKKLNWVELLRNPLILEGPQQMGQSQNWLPHPCLLGGPQVGGIATSPLHSQRSPTKGTKIRIGCLTPTQPKRISPNVFLQKWCACSKTPP